MKWLATAHGRHGANVADLKQRFLALGTGPGKVQQRGTFYTDCHHQNWDEMEIHGKTMDERMRFFDKACSKVVEQFYEKSAMPDDLIHVSCTGYVAPSPVQRLVSNKGAETTVTHAYHMGCYAAVPALRMGQGFLAAGKNQVDVVHTELCTLHMGTHRHTVDQLIVETLFGDGLIKYSLGAEEKGFEILKLSEEVIPNTLEHMTWNLESWGMGMTLAIDIPLALGRGVKRFVRKLYGEDLSKAYFAIHPGGPKIIEQIARILKLEDWQVEHSKQVLQSCGNMSSATLPHIWSSMLEDIQPGSEVVSLAFGPGLTIVGAVLRCC
ncbi:MAG: naringenin-chalcone synthase [Chlamydiia bacterium]|nr:naringenin-chalcone synthase [Chlamydiia bacterium]